MILSKRPEVERFLASPDPAVRAVVIHGKDRGGVGERGQALCLKIVPDLNDPFDVTLLTDSDVEADGAALDDALSAQSMTGGRRLVRLRLSTDKASTDKAVAAALKIHADGGFNPDAMFVVEAGALGRDSALRKAAETARTAVGIACYEDEVGDVARMVREALAKDRVGLTSDALAQFTARLPRERGLMRQEIERLALFIGPGSDRTLGPDELELHLGVEPDASLFEAALQAFGGRAAQAQANVRRAIAEGESPVAAVRAVSGHLNRLRKIRALTDNGAGPKEATKAAGVFWKQEAEVLRQMRSWRHEDLSQVLDNTLECEKACKTAGSPDALLAERLLLEVAGRARRLGL